MATIIGKSLATWYRMLKSPKELSIAQAEAITKYLDVAIIIKGGTVTMSEDK